MNTPQDPLEILWDGLLSRQPDQIQKAFDSLEADEQAAVRIHLQRMATKGGWHPEQRRSAQMALSCLDLSAP